jgi:hypothetical protein
LAAKYGHRAVFTADKWEVKASAAPRFGALDIARQRVSAVCAVKSIQETLPWSELLKQRASIQNAARCGV